MFVENTVHTNLCINYQVENLAWFAGPIPSLSMLHSEKKHWGARLETRLYMYVNVYALHVHVCIIHTGTCSNCDAQTINITETILMPSLKKYLMNRVLLFLLII